MPWLWKANVQSSACKARFFRDQLGGFFGLAFVGIAFRDRALGDAVRGEDHGEFRSVFGAGFFPAGAQFFGEGFGEQGLIVPLLDEVQRERKISRRATTALR